MTTDESRAKPVVDDKAWQEVIVVSTMADLFGNHLGLPLPQTVRKGDGALRFAGPASGVSRKSAPARQGQIFRATTVVHSESPGELHPVHFGPMFLDAHDRVLVYSRVIPIITPGAEQAVELEYVAPPEAASVRLRLVGGWAANKDSSLQVTTYTVARLYRKIG